MWFHGWKQKKNETIVCRHQEVQVTHHLEDPAYLQILE